MTKMISVDINYMNRLHSH